MNRHLQHKNLNFFFLLLVASSVQLFIPFSTAGNKSSSVFQPGQELKDADFAPAMVYVPEGTFKMGDNFKEGSPDEQPVHEVYIDGFFIGKYEITNAEFGYFIADSGYSIRDFWSDSGWSIKQQQTKDLWISPKWWNDKDSDKKHAGPKWSNFPVIGISWYEAEAYCAWLSAKTGNPYRLPTEAEWEKAARGTDQRRYPWGNEFDSSRVNFWKSGDIYDNKTTPAGYYDGSIHSRKHRTMINASPYGVCDMAGNVWEYCLDWYDGLFYRTSPHRNPRNVTLGAFRVIRGGSWKYAISDVRAAARDSGFPSHRDDSIGFRCVRQINKK